MSVFSHDVHFLKSVFSFLQLFSILHKMQKHEASVNFEMEKYDTSHEMCLLRCKYVDVCIHFCNV